MTTKRPFTVSGIAPDPAEDVSWHTIQCRIPFRKVFVMCVLSSTVERVVRKVGEGVFVDGQDKHARARTRRRTDDDEDEDGDGVVCHEDEDGEDVEAGGSTRPPRTRVKGEERTAAEVKASAKAKGKGKARGESNVMDEDEEEKEEADAESAIMFIFLRSLAHLVWRVQCSQQFRALRPSITI